MVREIEETEIAEAVNKSELQTPYAVGMFNDELVMGRWEEVSEKILSKPMKYQLQEIRVFDSSREIKIFMRDGKLYLRDTKDYSEKQDEYYDEYQLLDIDTTKTDNAEKVFATGGGEYSLPGDIFKKHDDLSDARVCIRYYLKYYPSGQAYVYDWRIVKFVRGETD